MSETDEVEGGEDSRQGRWSDRAVRALRQRRAEGARTGSQCLRIAADGSPSNHLDTPPTFTTQRHTTTESLYHRSAATTAPNPRLRLSGPLPHFPLTRPLRSSFPMTSLSRTIASAAMRTSARPTIRSFHALSRTSLRSARVPSRSQVRFFLLFISPTPLIAQHCPPLHVTDNARAPPLCVIPQCDSSCFPLLLLLLFCPPPFPLLPSSCPCAI